MNKNTMSFELMSNIIDELSKWKTGIQWTGGEPLLNPNIIDGIKYASFKKINQCLFTNGLLLTPEIVDKILKSDLKFIRVSLNAVSSDIHAQFHGYAPSKKYILRIIENIKYLVLRKNELKSKMLLGISIVYDRRNVFDIENILKFIRNFQIENKRNTIDYVIIRPAFKIYNNDVKLENDTYTYVENVINNRKSKVNAKVILTKNDNILFINQYPNLLYDSNNSCDCLSYGWFGEILPNGDVLLCSDTYGNPNYIIGNLHKQSLEAIWHGYTREKLIKKVENIKCSERFCSHSGRGYYLNQIFHQIERYRRKNNIEEVVDWLEALQRNTPYPNHSFFI